MTPKEKAIELVESMAFSCRECDYEFNAKQCALIAVDEILRHTYMGKTKSKNDDSSFEYWEEVKQEIEKL